MLRRPLQPAQSSPAALPPALVAAVVLAAIAGCPAPPGPQATPAPSESRRPSQPTAPSRAPSLAPVAAVGSVAPIRLPGLDGSGTPRPASGPSAAAPALRLACPEALQVGTPPFAPAPPIRPNAVAADAQGALWIAFDGRAGLWKATRDQGAGCGWTATRVTGSESLSDPRDLALDPRGRWLWIADHANHRIARLDTEDAVAQVETVAGGAGTFADGAYADARFWHPAGIAVDQYGAVYVADSYNHRVRRLWNGRVTTVAGGAVAGSAQGQFNYPLGVAVAVPTPVPAGRPTPTPLPVGVDPAVPAIFVADTRNHRIVRLQDPPPPPGPVATPSPGGQLSGGSAGGNSTTVVDGAAPQGKPGFFTVIAGDAGQRGLVDGPGPDARFAEPGALRYQRGTLWVTDTGNHAVRRLGSLGVLAASPTPLPASAAPRAASVDTYAGSGSSGDGDGAAREASFRFPRNVAVGPDGAVWIADTENDRVRVVRPPAASPAPEPGATP